MSELEVHSGLVGVVVFSALVTVVTLQFISAPYGRHGREGWGPTIPPKFGWILMESPAVLVFALFFSNGSHARDVLPRVFCGLWQLHYVYRTFVFPFRMRSARRMPLSIALSGFSYNVLNAYINARWASEFGSYPTTWLADPRFMFGIALFLAG